MTAIPEPTVTATSYTVNCLPDDDINGYLYGITVEYAGNDRWAVRWMSRCLNAGRSWDWEPIPSEREDDWLDGHRFDLDTALKLAKEAAPHITVNGITVADALRRAQRRT